MVLLIFFLMPQIYSQGNTDFLRKPYLAYNNFYQNFKNPSAISYKEKWNVNLVSRLNTQAFKAVRSAYFQVSFNPSKKHVFHLDYSGTQNGPFIAQNRVYIGYGNKIDLNEQWSLKGSLQLGLINIAFKGNTAGNGASSFSFDANTGLSLEHEKITIGGSILQISNSLILPSVYRFNLSRYFELYTQYKTDLSPNTKIKVTPNVTLLDFQKVFGLSTEVIFYDQINAGGAVNYKQDWSLLLGYKSDGEKVINTMLIYSFPFNQLVVGQQKIEILLSLGLNSRG